MGNIDVYDTFNDLRRNHSVGCTCFVCRGARAIVHHSEDCECIVCRPPGSKSKEK